jgi:hypothetical protein
VNWLLVGAGAAVFPAIMLIVLYLVYAGREE